jgi:hypothetical protein
MRDGGCWTQVLPQRVTERPAEVYAGFNGANIASGYSKRDQHAICINWMRVLALATVPSWSYSFPISANSRRPGQGCCDAQGRKTWHPATHSARSN